MFVVTSNRFWPRSLSLNGPQPTIHVCAAQKFNYIRYIFTGNRVLSIRV